MVPQIRTTPLFDCGGSGSSCLCTPLVTTQTCEFLFTLSAMDRGRAAPLEMPSFKDLVGSSRWKPSRAAARDSSTTPAPLASPAPQPPHRPQPTPAHGPRSFSAGVLETSDASAAHPLLTTPPAAAGHSQRSVSFTDGTQASDIWGVPSDEQPARRATGVAAEGPRMGAARDQAGAAQAGPSTESGSPAFGTLPLASPAAGPNPPPLVLDPRPGLAPTQPPRSPFRTLFNPSSPPHPSISSTTPPRPSRAPPNLPNGESSAPPFEAASRTPFRVITPFETLLAKTIQEEMAKLLVVHKEALVANA